MQELIAQIEAFCRRHDMSETRFGELAMNDKPFVSQLKSGRDLRGSTAQKLKDFMADYEQQKPAAVVASSHSRLPSCRERARCYGRPYRFGRAAETHDLSEANHEDRCIARRWDRT